MADLGNLKIKDTYQLLLQTDAGGNLQKLDGSSPNPFIINQNLRYLDGTTHPSGFVLTSDGSGNASWSAVAFSGDVYISGGSIEGTTIELNASSGGTVSVPGLSWSSSTSGHISNSGLTSNVGIGTSTPNKPLTVVGDISGTTDLYLGDSVRTASTIAAQEQLTIKGRGLDNDYMILSQDRIDLHMDGAQYMNLKPGSISFNASGEAYDFSILGDDAIPIFKLVGAAGENRIRIRDHLTIGANAAVSHADSVKWGLAVTGSSLFYSGGTSIAGNAITAVGDISGTTDLYIGDNISASGNIYADEIYITNRLRVGSSSGGSENIDIIDPDGNASWIKNKTIGDNNVGLRLLNQDGDWVTYVDTSGNYNISEQGVTPTYLSIGSGSGLITASGNITLSGNTSYNGTISGTGSVTAIGGFVGEVDGNAATATKITSITNANIVQLAETQTLTNKTLTAPTLTTPALGTPASGNLISTEGYRGDSSLVTVGTVVTGTWASNRKFTESDTDIATTGGADIVYFGNEGGTVPGAIYYFNGLTWETSDANFLVSSTGLTAVALGETNLAGMVIRGMVTIAVSPGGVDGNVVYLSEAASKLATISPTTSGAIVRVMGYAVDTSDKKIWFDPDKTWVELS